jgi:hypothetical protein
MVRRPGRPAGHGSASGPTVVSRGDSDSLSPGVVVSGVQAGPGRGAADSSELNLNLNLPVSMIRVAPPTSGIVTLPSSGTLPVRYMISYIISYNLDIIPDIIVFKSL